MSAVSCKLWSGGEDATCGTPGGAGVSEFAAFLISLFLFLVFAGFVHHHVLPPPHRTLFSTSCPLPSCIK